jgi:hypothetical protein
MGRKRCFFCGLRGLGGICDTSGGGARAASVAGGRGRKTNTGKNARAMERNGAGVWGFVGEFQGNAKVGHGEGLLLQVLREAFGPAVAGRDAGRRGWRSGPAGPAAMLVDEGADSFDGGVGRGRGVEGFSHFVFGAS